MDCEQCQELEQQSTWGCGEPGEMTYNYTGATSPTNKICPRWFQKQPFVLSVYEDFKDYKRGALGNVREDLGYAHLQYLRALEGEEKDWEQENVYKEN